jgi:hypothetical protein
MDKEPYEELKSLTRQRTHLVWEAAQLGGALSDEDARLVQAMRDHPEYADLWDHLDELSDEQIERDGSNPIAHVTIHATIEAQIADGEPKETGETVEALMRQGHHVTKPSIAWGLCWPRKSFTSSKTNAPLIKRALSARSSNWPSQARRARQRTLEKRLDRDAAPKASSAKSKAAALLQRLFPHILKCLPG